MQENNIYYLPDVEVDEYIEITSDGEIDQIYNGIPDWLYEGNTSKHFKNEGIATLQILCIGTDRSQQTVQTKIRLLLKKQSDQGLRCLPFHQHLLDALTQCYIKLFYF